MGAPGKCGWVLLIKTALNSGTHREIIGVSPALSAVAHVYPVITVFFRLAPKGVFSDRNVIGSGTSSFLLGFVMTRTGAFGESPGRFVVWSRKRKGHYAHIRFKCE